MCPRRSNGRGTGSLLDGGDTAALFEIRKAMGIIGSIEPLKRKTLHSRVAKSRLNRTTASASVYGLQGVGAWIGGGQAYGGNRGESSQGVSCVISTIHKVYKNQLAQKNDILMICGIKNDAPFFVDLLDVFAPPAKFCGGGGCLQDKQHDDGQVAVNCHDEMSPLHLYKSCCESVVTCQAMCSVASALIPAVHITPHLKTNSLVCRFHSLAQHSRNPSNLPFSNLLSLSSFAICGCLLLFGD